jgi:hypothetical protein
VDRGDLGAVGFGDLLFGGVALDGLLGSEVEDVLGNFFTGDLAIELGDFF